MYHFAENYPSDIPGLDKIPFSLWYARVRAIPFKSDDAILPDDPEQVLEVLARPGILMDRNIFPCLDCKKKSILIGNWAAVNGRPFVFVSSSEIPSGEIHHVFPMVDLGRGFETADATLPEYKIGQRFPITYAEELQR